MGKDCEIRYWQFFTYSFFAEFHNLYCNVFYCFNKFTFALYWAKPIKFHNFNLCMSGPGGIRTLDLYRLQIGFFRKKLELTSEAKRSIQAKPRALLPSTNSFHLEYLSRCFTFLIGINSKNVSTFLFPLM